MADITAGEALTAATYGLAALALEKQQTGGSPQTDAAIEALVDATILIARDTREDS
ncbi:hypothetical protein MIU24_32400 [Streptomyces venezuelae]|uniref:hypothetical protein n=1 Tax=Streptomyces sp. B6(2022) TaxID=3404749 RepID=UPI00311E32F3